MIKEFALSLDSMLNESYEPYPGLSNRKFWDSVHSNLKKEIINKADEVLSIDFKVLPASLWLDYTRTGNRNRYQSEVSRRRSGLHSLILAEILENKGRYIDKLLDITWMTLNESAWNIPAHNNLGGMKMYRDTLPDVKNPIVDLMAAELAASLSLVKYFMKDQFDAISPLICQRIDAEIDFRVITPYLNRADYWWMGFMHDESERLNNWNPWINSNVLIATLLVEKDGQRKIKIIQKLIRSLDFYLEDYPDDGCCDEGPGYWGQAGASAFECLELLNMITDGKFNMFNNDKIIKMGKYIVRAHIDKEYVTNFADASAKATLSSDLIFRFGKAIGDENLMKFAAYSKSLQQGNLVIGPYGLNRLLSSMIQYNEITSFDKNFTPCTEHYFNDVQVFIKRGKQVYMTAKGGCNRENHNHNDIGSFMIYKNGLPLLIDVGNMVYTRETFSEKRYEIWVNQSIYHNSVTVDQVMQHDGYDYKATNLIYQKKNDYSSFSLNMEKAYLKSNIRSLHRSFTFYNESENITIEDQLILEKESNDILYTFMTQHEPELNGQKVIFCNGSEKAELSFNYDVVMNVEKIKLTDELLTKIWGDCIYRVSAHLKQAFISGLIKLTFKNI
ncbi:MAG: heparinase II/III family protein [Clostridia bacterium]|nr:heparinase II/III family protein [Clostridia bacterium]